MIEMQKSRKLNRSGDPKKAIGYIRVSTDEQANGPEAQRVEIDRWCQSHSVELVAVFEDRGVSGGAPLDKRPELLAAVDALAEHNAGCLVVAKRDRLARDVVAAILIERLAARVGACVVTANGAGNGKGPEDQLMRRLLDVFSEYERDIIRARTQAAMTVKRSRQEYTGGSVPYGWALAEDGKNLAPNKAEQAIISTARRLRTAGLPLRAIGEELQRRGMLPRSGRKWHAKTVRSLLVAKAA